jgi:hypothetical protein
MQTRCPIWSRLQWPLRYPPSSPYHRAQPPRSKPLARVSGLVSCHRVMTFGSPILVHHGYQGFLFGYCRFQRLYCGGRRNVTFVFDPPPNCQRDNHRQPKHISDRESEHGRHLTSNAKGESEHRRALGNCGSLAFLLGPIKAGLLPANSKSPSRRQMQGK